MGKVMVDAGRMMQAAGDAMVPTAEARTRSLELACDVEHTWSSGATATDPGGLVGSETHSFWYAEAAVADLDPNRIAGITAIACDFEQLGTYGWRGWGYGYGWDGSWDGYADRCGVDAVCSAPRVPLPPLRCVTIPVEIENGKVRARCGHVYESAPERDGESYGGRWRTVRVLIQEGDLI